MTYADSMASVSAPTSPRLSWATVLMIGAFSVIAVYCTAWSLHTIDIDSGTTAANLSLSEYRDMLAGVAGYPYQCRLLRRHLVFADVPLTGLPPHQNHLVMTTPLLDPP